MAISAFSLGYLSFCRDMYELLSEYFEWELLASTLHMPLFGMFELTIFVRITPLSEYIKIRIYEKIIL